MARMFTPRRGQVPDIRDPQAMRDTGYFQLVQQWAEKILGERANDLRKSPHVVESRPPAGYNDNLRCHKCFALLGVVV